MIERVKSFVPANGYVQCSVEAGGTSMAMDIDRSPGESSFSLVDISSGLTSSSYLLSCYPKGRYDSLVYSQKFALFYNSADSANSPSFEGGRDNNFGSSSSGNIHNNRIGSISSGNSGANSSSSNNLSTANANVVSVYDLSQGCHLQTVTLASMRSNRVIVAASASSCRPGVFFLATSADSSYPFVYAVIVNLESLEVRCIDISLRDFPIKSRGPVHDVLCHTDFPYLLVGLGDGFVQVWNYTNIITDDSVDASADTIMNNRDGGGMNPEARSDEGDDEAFQSNLSKQITNRSSLTSSSSSSSHNMMPIAVFLHPDNARDPHATRQHKLFQSVSLSINSKLVSVVWDRSLLCVYNGDLGSLSRASRVSPALLSPIGKFTSPEAIRLGSAAFHPTMPVICQLAAGEGRKFLLALLLYTSDMGLVDSTDLDPNTNIDFMHISSYSAHVVLRSSSSYITPSLVTMNVFKNAWMRKYGFNEPLISKIIVPTKIFTEGSGSGQIFPSTSFSNYISIHPYVEVGSDCPLKISFTVCAMTKPEINTYPFKPIAAFPASIPITASAGAKSIWPILPEDHNVVPAGAQFFPCAVKSNLNFKMTVDRVTDTTSSPSDSFIPWEAVVTGCSLTEVVKVKGIDGIGSSVSTSSHNEGQLCHQNLICVLQGTQPNSLESVFLSALDADFWSGFLPTVPTANDAHGSGLLILSRSGQKLSWLSSVHSKTSGDSRLSPNTQFSIDLKIPLYRIWTSLPGSPNLVIGLTTITERDKGIPMNCLMISASTDLQFDLSSNSFFVLWQSESVIELQWQPSTALSEHMEEMKNYDVKPLIGVLTDRRVLILDVAMKLHTQKILHKGPLGDAMDNVDSISWIGSSLAYSVSSGQVRYLIPTSSSPTQFENRRVNINRSLGFGQFNMYIDDDMDPDILALLPPTMTRNRSMRIVTCLPDRLLLSCIKPSTEYITFMSFTTRPCIPAEPVIRGLLATHQHLPMDLKELSVNPLKEALKQILVSNFQACPESSSSNVGENGAVPCSHSSAKLSLYLYESEYPELASLVAGNIVSVNKQAFSQFPRCRWIPSGLKFLYSIAAGRTKEACVDLFTQYPKFQEVISGEESFSAGGLPQRESLLGNQIFSAACVLLSLNCIDEALKLADVLGSDELLAVILSTLKDGQVVKKALNSLVTTVADKNHLLREILIARSDRGDDENLCDLYPRQLSLKSLGKYFRRGGLLKIPAPSASTDKNGSKRDKNIFDAEGIENARKTHSSKRHGGLGAITGHGVLSMDGVEEWIGRVKPDYVSTEKVGNRMKFGSPARIAESDEEKEDGAEIQSRPPSWVPDVGKGKDVDKVVGYWRFSDEIAESDADFVSNVNKTSDTSVESSSNPTPPAILNFIDLSKFCTVLELIDDKHSSNMEPIVPVAIEESQSAVDPGEDKDKVKVVNDLVFPIQDDMFRTSAIRSGLRVKIERGTAMDVGLYNALPERRKLTIEMMVSRIEDPNVKKGTTKQINTSSIQRHYLAVRSIGPPSGVLDGCKSIWSLFTEMDGSVTFLMGKDEPSNQQLVKTHPDVLKPAGQWTHIALVIDSTNGTSSDRPLNGNIANVSIFINGDMSNSGDVAVPPITEDDLNVSCVYVGLNLSGWRLTELRFWADIRTSTDIDTNMENYLPHASKRKRLQFRIGGSKRLFAKATTSSPAFFSKKPLGSPDSTFSDKSAVGLLQSPPLKGLSPPLVKPGIKNDGTTVGNGTSALAARKARMSLAAAGKTAVEINKSTTSTFSSSISPPSLSSSNGAPISSIVTVKKVSTLPALGLALKDVMSCLRRMVIPDRSLDNHVAFCQKSDNNRVLAVIKFRNDESFNVASKRTTFPVPAESVVSSAASTLTILTSDSKSIVSFRMNGGKKILQQPIAFPLVFWSQVESSSKVLLVLPHSVYSWNAVEPNAPLKLFDRTDIASQKRWMERKAISVYSLKDKYILLNTCRRVTSENKSCSQALADEFSVVTLHIRGTEATGEAGKTISFKGVSSIFLPNDNNQDGIAVVYLAGSIYNVALLSIESVISFSSSEEIDLSADDCAVWTSSSTSNKNVVLSTENSKNYVSAPNFSFLSPAVFLFVSTERNVLHVLMRNGEYFAIDLSTASRHEKVSEAIQLFEGNSGNKRDKYVLAAGLHKPWGKGMLRSNITMLTSEATFEMCFVNLE